MAGWVHLTDVHVGSGFDQRIMRRFRLPNGLEHEFTIKAEPDAVAVTPITTDGQIVLVRQFRPGPMEDLLELPGGYIKEGDGPVETAARELREETGYSGQLALVGKGWASAYSQRRSFSVLALDCEKVSDPEMDLTEDGTVELVPLEQLRSLVMSGTMTDVGPAAQALLHLEGMRR